jgi:hypothetical protein
MPHLTRRAAAVLLLCLFVLTGYGASQKELTPPESTPTGPCKSNGTVVRLCD